MKNNRKPGCRHYENDLVKNPSSRTPVGPFSLCLFTTLLLTSCSDFPIKRDSSGFPEKSSQEGQAGVSASTAYSEFQKTPAPPAAPEDKIQLPPHTPLNTVLKSDPVIQPKRELVGKSQESSSEPKTAELNHPTKTDSTPNQTAAQESQTLSKDLELPALEKLARRIDYLETRIEDLGQRVLLKGRAPAGNKAGQLLVTGVKPHPSDGIGTPLRPPSATQDPERGFLNDEPVQSYRRALITFKGKKYPEAILAFSGFLEKYPDHPFAGSAQFYIGESYLKQGEAKLAAQELMRVLTSYDRSPHISDALRQISAAEDTLRQAQQAAKHRQQLSSLFSSSPALTGLRQEEGSSPSRSSELRDLHRDSIEIPPGKVDGQDESE